MDHPKCSIISHNLITICTVPDFYIFGCLESPGSPQFDCFDGFFGGGPFWTLKKRQPAEKTAECKAALWPLSTTWQWPSETFHTLASVLLLTLKSSWRLRFKIMLSFGLGSQNSKKTQQIQHYWKGCFKHNKIWRPAWLQILQEQGTLLEILGAILMCSSRFQYKLSDLLKMLWKVKHILPNGGLTVIYHGTK